MKQYLDILKNVVDNGTWKENRTGIRTKSITGAMFEHDLREGFPLLTTKKMGLKSVAAELEFFIKGLSDKDWLQERGCSIWNEWSYKDGRMLTYPTETQHIYQLKSNDLGVVYGSIWRDFDGNKRFNPPNANIPYKKLKPSVDNEIYTSNGYGNFIIIGNESSKNIHIQFIDTGYEYIVTSSNIKNGMVKDPYYKKYYGVACIGVPDLSDVYHKQLKTIWTNMISRCYNTSDKDYSRYGGNGVYVSNDWLIYSNFQEDCKKLTNWNLKVDDWTNYTLDKDIHGGKSYSVDTCLWLDIKEQSANKITTIMFDVITPTNDIIKNVTNLTSFCASHNIDVSNANKRLNGKYDYLVSGYDFTNKRVIYEDKFGYNNGVDQLRKVIDTLNTNPTDRRMLVTAWNASVLDKQALPPCHYAFQILSDGEHVDLLWNQRSVDTPLGLPYNIASYALLLMLIAKEAGMIPRKLIGFLADVHIYENQMDGVLEQLSRPPMGLPHVEIKNFNGIFNWKYDDFELVGYESHPAIKFPIAV